VNIKENHWLVHQPTTRASASSAVRAVYAVRAVRCFVVFVYMTLKTPNLSNLTNLGNVALQLLCRYVPRATWNWTALCTRTSDSCF